MTRMLAAQRFQGSVLVAKHGQILLSKGYGWADAELKIGNTAQTRFRLASVSKQFTAFAILHLQAQNKLSVHDSVCRYLADCPPHWQPITIHHLLTHTSGLPNYTNFASFGATRATPTTPQALMARFSDQRLQSSPGAIFQYENSDYVVLGLIIEQVAGQEYADVLHNVVFGPLGMSSSGVAPSVAAVGIDALGYRAPAYPSPPLDPSTLYGCGSLASSVEDLFRWTSALFSGQLLPEAEREQMFTAQARRYGYGWFVERPGGRLRIGHPGKIDGFASSVAHYPEHDLTVIVLSNLWSTDADGISARLVDLVLNNP